MASRSILPMPGYRFDQSADLALVAQAEALQDRLRLLVDPVGPGLDELKTVAGLDVSYHAEPDMVVGAVVVLDWCTLGFVDQAVAITHAAFPYIPGLLAFREVPALVAAWNNLSSSTTPELIVVDGHGLAHPRRFGLACHLGILAGVPTIGLGKSALIGRYDPPGPKRGDWSPVLDQGEVVGRALRTQDDVKEVFVSIGHGIDLDAACECVLHLAPKYRLPETTRAADSLSRRVLRGALGPESSPR